MKKILSFFLIATLILTACESKISSEPSKESFLEKKVYVAVENNNQVAIVDPKTATVVKRVDLPGMPHNVQVSPDGETVWVTVNAMSDEEGDEMHATDHNLEAQDQVIIINTETDTIIQQVKLDTDLHLAHVVLSPDNSKVYITAQEANEILVVNAKTYTLEKTIELAENAQPHGLRLSPDGEKAYIALMGGKGMEILNLETEESEKIDFKDAVVQTGVTPNGKYAFASLYSTKQLGVYNIETKEVNTIVLPEAKGPVQVYSTPDSRYVYVADQGYYFDQPISNKVYKVDLLSQKVVATIAAGEGPHGVAMSKDGLEVYVSNLVSGDLSIIDTETNKVQKTVEIGEAPNGVSVWEKSGPAIANSSTIVELKDGDHFRLTAGFVRKEINGKTYEMLAYNGSIPGPTLKVKQGSTITIDFTNGTNVATTLHSHGIRLDNAFDGVPNVTQDAIEPGKSFSYKIRFDDAGVFWYHPHLREDYTQDMGLYGNYIVEPKDASELSPVNVEQILTVDDISIEDDRLAPYFKNEVTHTLMGRFGNTMLVNGSAHYNLDVKKNEVIRFYVTNTANTRVFNLSIPGAKMKLVGADNGYYEQETWMDEVLIGPSERVIIDVLFADSGEYKLLHTTPDKNYTMGRFTVSNDEVQTNHVAEFNVLKNHLSTTNSIDPYRSSFNSDADKKLGIDINMNGMDGMHSMHGGMMMHNSKMNMGDGDSIEWEDTMSMMNSGSNTDTLTWQLVDEETGKKNEDIDDWNFKKGDVMKVEISNSNDSMHPMQHPIHIHGQRFLVLSVDGKETENLVWKDTVLIPAGSTVELLVTMDNPGEWMVHCHIPEHLESGMMLHFNVW